MKILFNLLITACALLLTAYFLPGVVVDGFTSALVFAIVLGLINLVIRPVLKVLTFPITLLTLGLFSFVLNAILFFFAASFIDGVMVMSFLDALFASLIVSLISSIGHWFAK